jgi:hypothetical protein
MLPGSSGQCQSMCPNGATDPTSLQLCQAGFNPVPTSNGNYDCLDGSAPNPPASPLGCVRQAAYANPANCPQGMIFRPDPGLGISFCEVSPQLELCAQQNLSVGLDGSCQSLCPGGEGLPYLVGQCCPAGMTAAANGQCECRPDFTFSEIEKKCVPRKKEGDKKTTSQSSENSAGVQLCPDGTPVQAGSTCPQQLPPPCPAGQYPGPDFTCKSCPSDQQPYYSEARKLWVCVTSATPNCQSGGGTLYCAPQAGGSCPPLTVPFNGGSCLGPALTCPSGVASMCCPGFAVPNFNTGACCPALQVPDSQTGQCVCAPGTNLVDGQCVVPPQCPAGSTLLPSGGCCPNNEVQDGGCVALNPPPPPPPQPNCAPGYSLGADQMCHRSGVGILCPPHTGEIPAADGRSCVCPLNARLGPTGACQCGGSGRLAGPTGCGPQQIPCAPAQKTTNGQCCPDGTTAQGNGCSANCAAGTTQYPDGTCSTPCGPGQQLELNGKCGPILTPPPPSGKPGSVPLQEQVPTTQPSTTGPIQCAPGVPPGTAGCVMASPPPITLQGRTNQPNQPALTPQVETPTNRPATTPSSPPAPPPLSPCFPGTRRIGVGPCLPFNLPKPCEAGEERNADGACVKQTGPKIDEGKPTRIETPRIEPRVEPKVDLPRIEAPRFAPRVSASPQWKFRLPLLGKRR